MKLVYQHDQYIILEFKDIYYIEHIEDGPIEGLFFESLGQAITFTEEQ